MLRALLIDDEPDARADLRQLLGAHTADVEIVGEAETLDEIEALLARPGYDAVFLDVQLRGGTAFDLVPRIRPDARVVFVTAHDRYAVRAFEVNALDYLLKPISPERLASAIERVRMAQAGTARGSGVPLEEDAGTPLRVGDVVYLRTGTQGRFAPLHQLCVIEAEQNYSVTRLVDGSRTLLRRTLKSWEDMLPATHFMRVHRTAIVNLERVIRYERDREERTWLFVEGGADPVVASRKLWPELQARLQHLRRVV